MPLIDDLQALYRVDRQVRGLRSRVDSADLYRGAQQGKVDELVQRHEELETRKRQRQAHAGTLETEGLVIDERTERLREDLNAASTTRQYHAVLNEVNTLKDKRSEIDDQILTELTGVDELTGEIEGIDGQLADRRKVLEKAAIDLSERKSEIQDSLNELEGKRSEKAACLPDGVLDLFDSLAEDFDGDAMASIELIDKKRREYSCEGCNVHLPFDVVSRVIGRPDEIIQCQGCLRILFAGEACREALVK